MVKLASVRLPLMAFALVAVLSGVVALATAPGAYALTATETANLIASTSGAIDDNVTTNFWTVLEFIIPYVFLFGLLAVLGVLLWKGIRTLMGYAK